MTVTSFILYWSCVVGIVVWLSYLSRDYTSHKKKTTHRLTSLETDVTSIKKVLDLVRNIK